MARSQVSFADNMTQTYSRVQLSAMRLPDGPCFNEKLKKGFLAYCGIAREAADSRSFASAVSCVARQLMHADPRPVTRWHVSFGPRLAVLKCKLRFPLYSQPQTP